MGADKILGMVIIVVCCYLAVRVYLRTRVPPKDSVLWDRAHDVDGKFVADDKSTPKNEAYVGGKRPVKRD